MTANLKPCSFCGNEKIAQKDNHEKSVEDSAWDSVSSSIECSCGVKFSPYSCSPYNYEQRKIDEGRAIEAWNHRPFEEKAVEVLATALRHHCYGPRSGCFKVIDSDRAEAKQLLGVRDA
jgi:hypothetical protein